MASVPLRCHCEYGLLLIQSSSVILAIAPLCFGACLGVRIHLCSVLVFGKSQLQHPLIPEVEFIFESMGLLSLHACEVSRRIGMETLTQCSYAGDCFFFVFALSVFDFRTAGAAPAPAMEATRNPFAR